MSNGEAADIPCGCPQHQRTRDGFFVWRTFDKPMTLGTGEISNAHGVPIVEGLRCWNNDLQRVIVKIAGTHADPASEFHEFWNGWFDTVVVDGERAGQTREFDCWRLRTRHPVTGEAA